MHNIIESEVRKDRLEWYEMKGQKVREEKSQGIHGPIIKDEGESETHNIR